MTSSDSFGSELRLFARISYANSFQIGFRDASRRGEVFCWVEFLQLVLDCWIFLTQKNEKFNDNIRFKQKIQVSETFLSQMVQKLFFGKIWTIYENLMPDKISKNREFLCNWYSKSLKISLSITVSKFLPISQSPWTALLKSFPWCSNQKFFHKTVMIFQNLNFNR